MYRTGFYNEGFAVLDEGVVLNEEGIVSVGGCVVLNEEGTVSVGGDEQRDEYKEHVMKDRHQTRAISSVNQITFYHDESINQTNATQFASIHFHRTISRFTSN